MRVFRGYSRPVPAPVVLAIGNFDGVHLGHAALIRRLAALAAEHRLAPMVLTFEPHPRTVFRPDTPVFRLTPAPLKARILEGNRIEVPVGNDGHYQLTAQVNGVAVRFVIDTGASSIALGPRDAERAGIDLENLAYIGQAQTANGTVDTAPVRLDSVAIGDISDQGVPAMVLRSDLDQSLMGMSYLSRFARVSIEQGRLILER